jgi:hypothetical protein
MRVVAVVLVSWAVVACEADLGTCDMAAATKVAYLNGVPLYEGQAIVNSSCAGGSCHANGATGAGRNGAPHGLNFDVQPVTQSSTATDVATLKDGVTKVRDEAGELWGVIDDGSMPPGEAGQRPSPTFYSDAAGTMVAAGLDLATSKDKVRNWLACQAPVVSATSNAPLKAEVMALGPAVDSGTASIAPNFASIYDNLLKTCVSCHSATGAYKQLVIDFASKDTAYATLVGKMTVMGSGALCGGKTLVKAGDCENSVLYQKLKYTKGAPQLCGEPMPLAGTMVAANVSQAVCDWIKAGAMQ